MSLYYKSFLLLLISLCSFGAQANNTINLPQSQRIVVGEYSEYIKEGAEPLTLSAAIKRFQQGGVQIYSAMPNFGVGSAPLWLKFEVNNASQEPELLQLVIENSWLDSVDVYFIHQHNINKFNVGDKLSFNERQVKQRFFAFNYNFEPGHSSVYIRVETPDPMLLPVYLSTPEKSNTLVQSNSYYYGIIYGFILALMAYNAAIFISLKDKRYFYYVLYLGCFLLMNISYTGHGFQWFWSDNLYWQKICGAVSIMLFVLSGLLFAQYFLHTKKALPRTHKVLDITSVLFLISFIAALLLNNQVYILSIAILFLLLYPFVMFYLGLTSWLKLVKEAKYFVIATSIALLATIMTTLTVVGVVAYNIWTYHAVEVGILIESTLFALALAAQFNTTQKEKIKAEYLALHDPLTNIYNRRGFAKITNGLFSTALRKKRDFAIVMFDIDEFKQLNDSYGHASGDEVLKAIATILQDSARQGDVYARWGGEEFILALPETNLTQGSALAERIRVAIESLEIPYQNKQLMITASFGIACLTADTEALNVLIGLADAKLYQAKAQGKNCLCS